MKTIKKGVLFDMIKQVPRFLITDTMNIEGWTATEGIHSDYGVFERWENTKTTKKLGDEWKTGYHRTTWFEADVIIPENFVDKKLYLEIDFGGEALVRIDGKIVGAVSSGMKFGWVNRDQIFLPVYKEAGKTIHIEIESALNSAGFCDFAMEGATEETYILDKARIVAVDTVTESYIYDINTLWGALDFVEDRYINAKLYEALDNSVHLVDFDFDGETGRKSIVKAKKYLDDQLKKLSYIPTSTVYLTGHCHIDIAWLWEVRETVRKTARTMANNLELMDRYPDMVFTQSQAILYDFLKKHYPEIYERIKVKIKEGKWIIEGNSWVEADTNVASGEALIRQLLYGREFFLNEFGVKSDTYWLPDCFGFSWALPQIIRRSGMKYFVSAKLAGQDINPFPVTTFKWKGADGSEVLAHIVKGHGYGGESEAADIMAYDKDNEQADVLPSTVGMFGYGDGGGGCTYSMVERAQRLDKIPGLPNVKMQGVSALFREAEKKLNDLPTWYDEMYYENHRGTYTSQAIIKKYNRQSEFLLTRTEMLLTFLENVTGEKYPKEKLEEIWKLLLKNQFHDTLPGTSIHEAHIDAKNVFEKLMKDAEEIRQDALSKLSGKISAEKDSVIVWNMLSFDRSGFVNLGDKTFYAENVPAFGYKIFDVENIENKFRKVKATEKLLENEKLKVRFDKNGLITSIYDKSNKRETLSGKGNLLTIFQDKPIHESAWNLEINYQKKFWDLIDAESVSVIESSEEKGVVEIVRKFNKSTITQKVVLRAGTDRVDFETEVDWHETEKVLKAAFNVDILATKATYEIAHGSIERPNHYTTSYDLAKFEVSAHKWADLSESDYGISILNDSKYGYDIYENRMRITLMRSPNCPDRTSDHGINTFVYSYLPHNGNWTEKTVEEAFSLNVPLEAYEKKAGNGIFGREKSFITTDCDNVVIDALKKSQDEKGYILRLYESKKERKNVTVALGFDINGVIETNLMEEEEKTIKFSDNSFSFLLKPGEVKTFKILTKNVL
ncbi:MAG: alpha-mannosidase [Clostridia bacterium]|nr:alpha-mannosidase [Clostridia bacterium]